MSDKLTDEEIKEGHFLFMCCIILHRIQNTECKK